MSSYRTINIASYSIPHQDKAWCLYILPDHKFLLNSQGQVRVFTTRSGARGVRSLIERGIVRFRTR